MRVRPLARPALIGRFEQCRPLIGRDSAAEGAPPERPPLARSQLRKTSFSLLSIMLGYNTMLCLSLQLTETKMYLFESPLESIWASSH